MTISNNLKGRLMLCGGMLMVVCSAALMAATLLSTSVWGAVTRLATPWGFLLGAVLYVTMQRAMRPASGESLTLRRLSTIQLLAGLCFVLAGVVMVEQFWQFLQPLVASDLNSYRTYLQVTRNNWVVLLLIGALLQMYTTHRIASELKRKP